MLRKFFPWFCTGIFFLPYLGSTTFRLDQFFGFMIILAAALLKPKSSLWWHALTILIFVFLRSLVRAESLEDVARATLNFSYPAVGMSLLVVCRRWQWPARDFVAHLMWFSVPINLIAIFMWVYPWSGFSGWINLHYGGPVLAQYGRHLTLANATLEVGRISSVFAHPMALACFSLLIGALALAEVDGRKNPAWNMFIFALSLAGGLTTGSKTYL